MIHKSVGSVSGVYYTVMSSYSRKNTIIVSHHTKVIKMLDYIKLIRPPLFILGFIAPYTIGLHYHLDPSILFNVTCAIGFGNAAFVVANEIRDVPQDRIIKPWKPLPSGRIPLTHAYAITLGCFIISVVHLIKLPADLLKFGVLGYITAFVYNVMKERAIIGNVCLGLTYFVSAFMASGLTNLTFPLSFSILTVTHNFAVQIQDIEGDKKAGVMTTPIVLGKRNAEYLAVALSILGFALFLHINELWCIPFALASLTIVLAIITEKYELFVRIGVRALMLLGFIAIGVMS